MTPDDSAPQTSTDAKKGVQSIERAVEILRCFTLDHPTRSFTEIVTITGLHKTTTHRILATLESAKLIRRDGETGRYALGLGLVQLAGIILSGISIREIAHPYLERLAAISQETVNLAIIEHGDLVNVSQVQSQHSIRYLGQIGRFNPLHATSGGKVALAYLPAAEVERHLQPPLQRFTERTICDRAQLEAEVARIRKLGYGIARDELEAGVTAISAPIMDARNQLTALIGISGPSTRMTEEQVQQFAPHLTEAATNLSIQFGSTRHLSLG